MENNKYTFKFTIEEMKMIRNALALEANRREENNLDKVEDYDELTEFFAFRIRNAIKK